MITKVSTHTFTKGLVTDRSNIVKSKEAYDYAENLRHTNDEEGVLGSLTTLKGFENFTLISGGLLSTLTIVAQTTVRNKLYLLCTSRPSAGGADTIYSYDIDYQYREIDNPVMLYGGGSLGLSYAKNTDVVSIYENDNVIKLYWTTDGNQLKVANVATYLTTDGLVKSGSNSWIDPDRFNIVTARSSEALEFVETVNGSLETGKVQYCYSLYKENLQESIISSATKLIDLFQDKESKSSNIIKGDYTVVNTNKGIKLSITLDSDDVNYFDYIRLYRIHYKEYGSLPIISIVNDYKLLETTDYTIVDNGESILGEITPEEFTTLLVPYGAKTLAIKDNRLFLGNIEEYTFDLPDFDSRAYRFFRPYGNGKSGYTLNTDVPPGYYEIYFNTNIYLTVGEKVRVTFGGLPVGGIQVTVTSVITQSRQFRFLISELTGSGVTMSDGLAVLTVLNSSEIVSDLYTTYGAYSTPEFTINGSTLTYPNMSSQKEINCVNPFNDIDEDLDHTKLYMYQSDGTTYGGEGPEIKYSFITQGIGIDVSSTYSNAQTYKDLNDYSHTSKTYEYTGYQRDEVYRFGIVFYNASGQKSKVKWIGDIRFPSHTEYTNFSYVDNSTASSCTAYSMGLYFELKNGLPSGAVAWEIVRAERTKDDKSVISAGLSNLTIEGVGTGQCRKPGWPFFDTTNITVPGTTAINYYILNYATPQELFQGYSDIVEGDYIDIVGDITDYVTFTSAGGSYPDYNSDQNSIKLRETKYFSDFFDRNRYTINANNFLKSYPFSSTSDTLYYSYDRAVNGTYKLFSGSPTGFLIGALYFTYPGLHGSCSVPELETSISSFVTYFNSTHNDHDFPYTLVKRNTTSRYGGYTYLDRENIKYISCGLVTSLTSAIIFSGDTYINYFDYLYRPFAYSIATSSNALNIIFPVESPINLSLRSDDHMAKTYGINKAYLTQEEAGTYTYSSDEYNQELNLYLYNSIYSQQPTLLTYRALNNLDFETIFDSRVIHSGKKINNELIDSWLKFSANNILDVDSRYGEIMALRNHNNDIFFWQSHGFGNIPVNERSLIQDNNPGNLSLGIGDVMSRYVYYTSDYGCEDLLSIISTGVGLYWIDRVRRSIIIFDGQQVKDLSKEYEFKSLTKELIDSTSSPDAYTYMSTLNQNYNEILFKLSDTKQLLFNYSLPGVSSVLTFSSDFTFNVKDIVITYYLTQLYGHDKNSSYQNRFVNSSGNLAIQEALLRVTDNSEYPNTKVYDNISFFTNAKLSDIERYSDTFDTVAFWNDYQYTGVTTLTLGTTLRRSERGLSSVIPRNIVNANGTTNIDIFNASNHDTSRLYRERLRDKYITAEFKYNTSNVGKLYIPYIQFTYRTSKR